MLKAIRGRSCPLPFKTWWQVDHNFWLGFRVSYFLRITGLLAAVRQRQKTMEDDLVPAVSNLMQVNRKPLVFMKRFYLPSPPKRDSSHSLKHCCRLQKSRRDWWQLPLLPLKSAMFWITPFARNPNFIDSSLPWITETLYMLCCGPTLPRKRRK